MNPRPQHYWSAIHSGGFHSAFLQGGNFYKDAEYGPLSWEGGFAVVFKWRHPFIAQDWAVRFFIKKDVPTLREVYDELARHLAAEPLPYFVRTIYEPDAISVSGRKYPVVVMPWVDAQPLKTYLGAQLEQDNRQAVLNLAERWRLMLKDMRTRQISHGDFHHDNVHVNAAGEIILLDYDGVTVPSLVGKPEYIGGTPGYQHPARGRVKKKFLSIDAFSGIVVYLSLRMIAEDPAIWNRLHIDDSEALVFTLKDFLDPDHAPVFRSLLSCSEDVRDIGQHLRSLLGRSDVPAFPSLEDILNVPVTQIRAGERETELPAWMLARTQRGATPRPEQSLDPPKAVPPKPPSSEAASAPPVHPVPRAPVAFTERLKSRAPTLLAIAIIGTFLTIASIVVFDVAPWVVLLVVLIFAAAFAAVASSGGRGS